ncbi:hypothetical protein MN116_001925 [Schistosoma mekongi]|uniref:Rho-GAP domain-containing protein n=1 Tax=Schistosoma mekongi TaxID=38744 RepID=A0AAE2D8A7_SCHME|nr:hypothetical protein MN116_001925 [Schistosoma mekongi]
MKSRKTLEILLYLLDHFKRLTNNCEVNKMDTQNLATCLAPVLFYPSPSSARNLDPNILEPRKMAEIFKFILEIWPDDRSKTYKFSPSETWTSPYSSNAPLLEEQHQTGFYPQTHHHHPKHRYDQSGHRASSAIRSTISGPAGSGLGYRSPHTVQRSSILASKAESDKSDYAGIGRSGTVKYGNGSNGSSRQGVSQDGHRRANRDPRQTVSFGNAKTMRAHSAQRKTLSQTDITFGSGREYTVGFDFRDQQVIPPGDESNIRVYPRFQDIPTTGSTGTDSGTRSSLSVGSRQPCPPLHLSSSVDRSELIRSTSQERQHYGRTHRLSRRSHPFS